MLVLVTCAVWCFTDKERVEVFNLYMSKIHCFLWKVGPKPSAPLFYATQNLGSVARRGKWNLCWNFFNLDISLSSQSMIDLPFDYQYKVIFPMHVFFEGNLLTHGKGRDKGKCPKSLTRKDKWENQQPPTYSHRKLRLQPFKHSLVDDSNTRIVLYEVWRIHWFLLCHMMEINFVIALCSYLDIHQATVKVKLVQNGVLSLLENCGQ